MPKRPTKPVAKPSLITVCVRKLANVERRPPGRPYPVIILREPYNGLKGVIHEMVTSDYVTGIPGESMSRRLFYSIKLKDKIVAGLDWMEILFVQEPV